MLTALRIRDLVLIDHIDLELGPGFCVFTGETGAGKSVLVTAIGLALGSRGSPRLVRKGAATAEVEALFDLRDEPEVRRRLVELGLGDDEELLVKRTVSAQGRGTCRLNGHLAPVSMLARLATGLADVSSQHEHHALTDPSTPLFSLDAFAKLGDRRNTVTQAYRRVMAAQEELEALRNRREVSASRDRELQFLLEEARNLEPQPGEEEELRRQKEVLRSSASLLEAARTGERSLYSREGAVCERVSKVIDAVSDAAEIDSVLSPIAAQLQEGHALLEDAAFQLRQYSDRLDADPRRLAEIEDRLAAFARVRRVLAKPSDDLASTIDALESELSELTRLDEFVSEAESALSLVLATAAEHARVLTTKRKAAARRLARSFSKELRQLGMGQARVQVMVERAGPGEPSVDGARLTTTGADRVEFLIGPNPGEPARPLRQIASGGELSRAALALKRSLAGVGPVGTYIFDEIDAGISGAVADMVGRKLREVATHHQVLCVTHLPQVAAKSDSHFQVAKARKGRRTVTAVERLCEADRVEEVARMMSGSSVTEGARKAAAELMRA